MVNGKGNVTTKLVIFLSLILNSLKRKTQVNRTRVLCNIFNFFFTEVHLLLSAFVYSFIQGHHHSISFLKFQHLFLIHTTTIPSHIRIMSTSFDQLYFLFKCDSEKKCRQFFALSFLLKLGIDSEPEVNEYFSTAECQGTSGQV